MIVLTGRSEETERCPCPRPRSRRLRREALLAAQLEARIRAVLRRGQPATPTTRIEHDGLVVDRSAHRVEVAGEVVDLTPKEFDLLAFLAGRSRSGVQP